MPWCAYACHSLNELRSLGSREGLKLAVVRLCFLACQVNQKIVVRLLRKLGFHDITVVENGAQVRCVCLALGFFGPDRVSSCPPGVRCCALMLGVGRL